MDFWGAPWFGAEQEPHWPCFFIPVYRNCHKNPNNTLRLISSTMSPSIYISLLRELTKIPIIPYWGLQFRVHHNFKHESIYLVFLVMTSCLEQLLLTYTYSVRNSSKLRKFLCTATHCTKSHPSITRNTFNGCLMSIVGSEIFRQVQVSNLHALPSTEINH
jgi:hypothetical protein